MKIPYYHIDVFTDRLFKGNPAGVCLLPSGWIDDGLMQKIAFEKGVEVIVPIQKGKIPPYENWKTIRALLGFEFTAGIPANKAAFSDSDLKSLFSKASFPHKVHLLGISEFSKCIQGIIDTIQSKSEEIKISMDAARLLTHLGKGKAITETKSKFKEQNIDDTEIEGRLSGRLEPNIVERLAEELGMEDELDAMLEANESGSLASYIDDKYPNLLGSGFMTNAINRAWGNQERKEIGAEAIQEGVAESERRDVERRASEVDALTQKRLGTRARLMETDARQVAETSNGLVEFVKLFSVFIKKDLCWD